MCEMKVRAKPSTEAISISEKRAHSTVRERVVILLRHGRKLILPLLPPVYFVQCSNLVLDAKNPLVNELYPQSPVL